MTDSRLTHLRGLVVAAGIGLAAAAGTAVASAAPSDGVSAGGDVAGPAAPARDDSNESRARTSGVERVDRDDRDTDESDDEQSTRVERKLIRAQSISDEADETADRTPAAPAGDPAAMVMLAWARRQAVPAAAVKATQHAPTAVPEAIGALSLVNRYAIDDLLADDDNFNAVDLGHAIAGEPVRKSDFTKGWDITNLTGRPVILTSVLYDGRASGPSLDAEIAPGGTHHFELTRYFFVSNSATLTYQQAVTGRKYTVELSLNSSLGEGVSGIRDPYGRGNDWTYCSGGPCTPGSSTNAARNVFNVAFFDDNGSVVDIPGTDSEKQAKALTSLCEGSAARCKFKPSRTVQAYTAPHDTTAVVRNESDETIGQDVAISDKQGATSNIKLASKLTIDLAKIVKAEVSAEMGKQWTTEHTFTQTLKIPTIRAWTELRVLGQTPIDRVYGDMEITIGNSTIVVKDLFFELPVNDDKRPPIYTIKSTPIKRPEVTV